MEDFQNQKNDQIGFSQGGPTKISLYDILEISQDACKAQVREAYVRLKNTYASSNQAIYSLISEDEAKTAILNLEEAYRVLSDDILRKDYDAGEPVERIHNESSDLVNDPFGSDTPSQMSEDLGDTGPEEVPQRDFWQVETNVKRVAGKNVAIKKRFAGSALNSEVQEKIRSRVAEGPIDGSLLSNLREIQSVSLDELQDSTKVSLQYIIALENNDYQSLPSIVYVKGFLKICLQYLGVQEGLDRLVVKYLESLKQCQDSQNKIITS